MIHKNQMAHFIGVFEFFILVFWSLGCTPNSMVPLNESGTVDTVSISLHSSEPRSTSAKMIPVYASFSEELAELSIKSFKIKNGFLQSFQQLPSSPNTYLLEIIPSGIGTVLIEFTSESVWVKSSNSLKPTRKNQIAFDFYYVSPSTHFTPPSKFYINSEGSAEYTLTYGGTFTVMAPNFSELLNLFYQSGDVKCGPVVLTQLGKLQFKVQISQCTGNGHVRLKVEAGSASADNGPFTYMLAAHPIVVNNTAPVFKITPPIESTGNKTTIFSWRIELTDPTLDLVLLNLDHIQWFGDISNCSVLLSDGIKVRDLVVTNCVGTSQIHFILPAGVIKDPAGNSSEEQTSSPVSFSNIPI